MRAAGRQVTTREIADAAGIAEGTIFRVFESKDAVIEAVVAHVMDVADTVTALRHIDLAQPLEMRVTRGAVIIQERLASVFEIMVALHRRRPDSEDSGDSGAHDSGGRRGGGHGGLGHPRGRPNAHAHSQRHDQHDAVLSALAAVIAPDAPNLSCSPRRAAHLLWLLTLGGSNPMMASSEPLTVADIIDVLLHGITQSESQCPPC